MVMLMVWWRWRRRRIEFRIVGHCEKIFVAPIDVVIVIVVVVIVIIIIIVMIIVGVEKD